MRPVKDVSHVQTMHIIMSHAHEACGRLPHPQVYTHMRFRERSAGMWSLSGDDLEALLHKPPFQLPDEISGLVFVKLTHAEQLMLLAMADASTSPSPMKAACLQARFFPTSVVPHMPCSRVSSPIESRCLFADDQTLRSLLR